MSESTASRLDRVGREQRREERVGEAVVVRTIGRDVGLSQVYPGIFEHMNTFISS